MADFNDLPDEAAAPVLRAQLSLILGYFEWTLRELACWRRGEKDEALRVAVNDQQMICEIQLTRSEYLKGRTGEMLDADANRVIDRMNSGEFSNSTKGV